MISRRVIRTLFIAVLALNICAAQTATEKKSATKAGAASKKSAAEKSAAAPISEQNVRAHVGFLASDSLQGRKSATWFEGAAAEYVVSQLTQYGIEPGVKGGQPTFLQEVPVTLNKYAAPPALKAGELSLTHGKEMAVLIASGATVKGPLQKLTAGGTVQKGAVVLVNLTEGKDSPPVRTQLRQPLQQGAVAVLVADSAQIRPRFAATARALPNLQAQVGAPASPDAAKTPGGSIVLLNAEASQKVSALAEGTSVEISGEVKQEATRTRNVIGVLRGSDAKQREEVIMLSAHLDHVGTNPARTDDTVYNGADDNASGVAAVLELARVLAAGPRPKRTIYFVFFGSEEEGGWGSGFFIENPPVPLTSITTHLAFEMIGRPDPKIKADELWLTGFDRTNLGPELAKMGAKIVADPYPDQDFFARSDNYALAKRGVIAQTVSSFGLHNDYHQPGDEASKLDYPHMTHAIQSMVDPVLWLANGTFKPEWKPGQKP